MKKKAIAIITARGGSKRIPKKNIRNFCGKPMIAYSIEAALDSGLFDEVMVSTDSREIADIAVTCGAAVPFFRSAETSDDFASTSDVLLEVIRRYRELGQRFDYMCCIYPTAPFLTAEKLKEAMRLMELEQPVSVMPVVRFSYPPQRCFVQREDGTIAYKYEEYLRSRSQDLEPLYHDAGQFYLYHTETYLRFNGVVRENILPIIVPESEVQDIDTEEDFKIAELKYRLLLSQAECKGEGL